MFVVTVTFEIVPGRMEQFLPLMIENASASRSQEPGCHQFDVCRSEDSVFLYEVYENEDAFKAHLNMAHFRTFDAATAPMVIGKVATTYDEVHR